PGQGQQLLGIELARQRPQPRAGSAAENDWSEHGRSKEAAASRLNQRLAATDRMVGEAKAAHHGRIVEIAPVENDRRLEDLLQALEIGAPKLLPLGDDGERIRALRGLVGILRQHEARLAGINALRLKAPVIFD